MRKVPRIAICPVHSPYKPAVISPYRTVPVISPTLGGFLGAGILNLLNKQLGVPAYQKDKGVTKIEFYPNTSTFIVFIENSGQDNPEMMTTKPNMLVENSECNCGQNSTNTSMEIPRDI